MIKSLLIVASLFVSGNVFAWSAISLGGGNWAIICANGSAWSYSGSSAGLDVVGPALCPGGFVAPTLPNRPGIGKVAAGIAPSVSREVRMNLRETTETTVQKTRTYPPHGYPCLGCAPCPGNPSEFCDINNLRCVYIPPQVSTLISDPLMPLIND